jgi:hypothetical protein
LATDCPSDVLPVPGGPTNLKRDELRLNEKEKEWKMYTQKDGALDAFPYGSWLERRRHFRFIVFDNERFLLLGLRNGGGGGSGSSFALGIHLFEPHNREILD